MLSQTLEQLSVDDYATRAEGSGFRVQHGPRAGTTYNDGIWGVMAYADPEAGIRFVTQVLGFEEQVLVRDPSGRTAHSVYRWPEGRIVPLPSSYPGNPFLTYHRRTNRLSTPTPDERQTPQQDKKC